MSNYLTPRQQAAMRYGVREIRDRCKAHGVSATHEILDLGKHPEEPRVLMVGDKEQCTIVCTLLEKVYVDGATYNEDRVTIAGTTYRLTPT